MAAQKNAKKKEAADLQREQAAKHAREFAQRTFAANEQLERTRQLPAGQTADLFGAAQAAPPRNGAGQSTARFAADGQGSGVAMQRGLDFVAPSAASLATDAQASPDTARRAGRIVAIRHEQLDEDFYIFSIQPIGTLSPRDRVSVKGHGVALREGMEVDVCGEWLEDPRWGRQIHKALVSERLPVTAQGMQRLLERGFVRGIGPEMATKLIRRFGDQLFDVAEKSPEYLYQVDGIGAKRVEALVHAVKEKRAVPRIMAFLADVGLGPQMSHRVYRELGSQAVDLIKKNPYELTRVPMIGFLKADAVARSLGVPFDSDSRIVAALEAALLKASEQGSTAMPVDALKAEMGRMLSIKDQRTQEVTSLDAGRIDQVVERTLSESSRIHVREISAMNAGSSSESEQAAPVRCASLKKMHVDEQRIAKHLARLTRAVSGGGPSSVDFSHPRFAHLDEGQLAAARQSLAAPVSVITGRPGCGKTTVTKSIIDAFEDAGMKVLLVAPTGKAAKRMSEATGRPASTVHRALKSQGAGKFGHDENNPLEADVIFADEFSMMETHLSEKFLRAIRSGTRLVIIGDKDQLPSIGAGNVLADVIASDAVPVSVLTKIHRQAAGSAIIANAHRIISGEVPQPPQEGQKNDFSLIECHDRDKQIDAVVQTYMELLARGIAGEDIQILTPLRKAEDALSSTSLNRVIKELVNPAADRPAGETVKKGKGDFGVPISVGDRVMQMANNKDLGIYNGDVGYILEIDKESKTIVASFNDDVVELSTSDIDDLDLAYATTIHKSQGSEYKAVIIPLSRSHGYMLDRNLLYTAETRGKEFVAMVGDTYMLKKAVARADNAKRITGLIDEIHDAFSDLSVNLKSSGNPSASRGMRP